MTLKISSSRLREERLAQFLSQQDLADKAGTSEATVNRLENGLQAARLSTIRKLAEALRVSPDSLLEDDKKPRPGK